MRILVTGGNGQFGRCFQDVAAQFPQVQFHFLSKLQLDVCNPDALAGLLSHTRPNVCINAAAYTAVDMAETEPQLATTLNGDAVGHMARLCKLLNIRFIHISTDYVFDGAQTTPYTENDAPNPLNVYGASKLKGEQLALQNPNAAVVRTSWVYSFHGTNFVKTMLRLMRSRTSIGVVADQYGCPTYGVDLAEAVMTMALAPNFVPGLFHYSNTGPISWWQFAQAIQQTKALPCSVGAIDTAAYPTAAKRPAFTALNCQKIADAYGVQQKDWQQSLRNCLALL
jgi:dTDP-4-dehydrorhamnose reductase